MKGKLQIASAILIILLIIILDLFYFEPNRTPKSIADIFMVMEEGHPKFNPEYIFRTLLLALSSLLIISFIVTHPASLFKENKIIENDAFHGWGRIVWLKDSYNESKILSISLKKLLLWILVSLFLFLVFLFYDRPGFFSKISLEDGIIENLSAVFYFISFIIFLYIIAIIYKEKNRFDIKTALLISCSFAIIFFILGMEEISWFQRVLAIESPEYFKEYNAQKELNIHNFFMEPIYVTVFYVSAFVFLILIPFLFDNFSYLVTNKTLAFFIPGRYLLFISAMFVAYNYDQWNVFVIQLNFFITFFILVYYVWVYYLSQKDYIVICILVFSFLLTQTIFIIYGERQLVREWEVTEYKEFLIPLSYAFYSVELLVRLMDSKHEKHYDEYNKQISHKIIF